MHRTTHVRHMAFWSVLLGMTLSGGVPAQQPPMPPAAPPMPPAEEALPAPRTSSIVVPINGTVRWQMSTKKPIRRVINEKEAVVRVSEIPNQPDTVAITGLIPDTSRLIFMDVDGKEEIFTVVVQFDVEYLKTLLQRAVPTSSVTPLPAANNYIILTGTVARVEDIDVILNTTRSVVGGADRIINALRVGGVMQVQLDVMVARVNRTEARSFGWNLLGSGPSAIIGSTVGGLTSVPTIGTTPPATFAAGNAGNASTTGNNTTGLLTGGAISAPPGGSNLFLGVVTNSGSFLGFLQALKDEGLAKILTQPKVVTLSGRPAAFVSGGEVPVPEPQGLGTISVRYRPFGTTVNFLPIVLGNGKIYLEVEPEVSRIDSANSITLSGTVIPGFATQRVRAAVEIEAGQTLAIGGLIEHETQAATSKTPILGEIPFIGAAFSVKNYRDVETELLIMVTPHLVDAMDCAQVTKAYPGSETRKPDDFELFLEGILEAPRGPRQVCPDGHYKPAFKNSPNANQIPCAPDKCEQKAAIGGWPLGYNGNHHQMQPSYSVQPAPTATYQFTPAPVTTLPSVNAYSPMAPVAPTVTESRPVVATSGVTGGFQVPAAEATTPPAPTSLPSLPESSGSRGPNVPE